MTENSYWKYKGSIVNSIEDFPVGSIGFIYEIVCTVEGWRYVGKKSLYSVRTLPPLKGQKRKRKVTKESDWLKYYSSNTYIKEYIKTKGDTGLQREILHIATTKKLLTYYENKYLYCKGVIEPNSIYLNDNISGKLFRGDWGVED